MLQELTNKIKKIIPDIEELKFGCKVKIGGELWQNIGEDKFICLDDLQNGIDHYLEVEEYIKENCEEIIGRDITLEDILRVLLLKYGAEFSIKIDGDCELFVGTKSCGLFDFGKPLHEQSEETIKELNNLI